MSRFEYFTPTDVGSAFRTEQDVAVFVDFMLDEAEVLNIGKGDDNIPPIVYNAMGRVYNIEYNFIIKCLAKFLEDDAILGDFSLVENGSAGSVMKAATFLILGLFEDYFGLVRANNYRIDLSKYRNKGTVDIGRRFYNVLVMQNGSEIRRFSAVPFAEISIKNLLTADRIITLEAIAKRENLKQIVFGNGKYKEYVTSTNSVPNYVEI